MTRLENAVSELLEIPSLEKLSNLPKDKIQIVQAELDEITPAVIQRLNPQDIIDHMKEVYSQTAEEYVATPHNQMVIDELIEFMAFLNEGDKVLDIGCGPGRDILFMSTKNPAFRLSLMERLRNGKRTRDKYDLPEIALRATGVDSSGVMLEKAKTEYKFLKLKREDILFPYDPDFPQFIFGDMHYLPVKYLMETSGQLFSGIWSCAALFIHAPQTLISPAMQSVARLLDKNGIFFTSYLNSLSGPYNKLMLSSTGRIKYFSHQNPEEIVEAANACGLTLQRQILSDLEYEGRPAVKDFFVSQFFQKS